MCMETSQKRGIVVLFILGISIFGYSQYASASQIEVSITESKLLDKTEKGSNYNIELQFENPSLLILTAGETEFFVIVNESMVGKGKLESFTLEPLSNSMVKGNFYTNSQDSDKSQLVKITGVTKYNVLFTSIDVPFVYYPTEEQAREFIHQE